MATVSEILSKRWPGRIRTMGADDDYSSLIWGEIVNGEVVNVNPESKPTEAAIRAFSNDVDLELAADRRDEKREAALNQAFPAGIVFRMVDTIVDYMAALHPALPANTRNQIPAAIVNRMQALRNKLNEIIAQNP